MKRAWELYRSTAGFSVMQMPAPPCEALSNLLRLTGTLKAAALAAMRRDDK